MGSFQEDKTFHCDVIIVGAGFSGVYGLHKFRRLGLDVKVFEAGADLGGVWYWNRYPGLRVDSEWPYYQLGIPEVWKDFYFTERFPKGEEIRSYFAHADKVLDLKKDIQFNARVNSATWDETRLQWTVTTEAGHTATAQYLCLFTGVLHRQYIPGFPDLGEYKGQVFHSAAWPEGVDVAGKRVAVIGAGATGVQLVQELSKRASHLTLFLRRPPICFPMRNRPIMPAEEECWKPYYELLFDASRKSPIGFPVSRPTKGIYDVSESERNEYYEKLWRTGGFHFGAGNYPQIRVDKNASRMAYDFWAKKTRVRIKDQVKRNLMVPHDPPFWILTRRSPLEIDYYESLDQDHVEIVSLAQTPIQKFTERGIQTADGKHREFDNIVCATGFESFTGSVATMNIQSKDGVYIKDIWAKGIRTYLGILVHGFPNCFLSYSPQAPTVIANGPTVLQCQIDFIVDAIAKMRTENLERIEATAEAEEGWRQMILEVGSKTLAAETDSWWTAANVPGQPRQFLTYVKGIGNYETECRATLDGWKGFDVRKRPDCGNDGVDS
ncbi:hypothetical protein BDV09DRAFT_202524 [Aspergillus tetrazonus]